MDSKQYYNVVSIKMQDKNYIGSNFTRKVGRELTIFTNDKSKREYIESKSGRVFEDYEYTTPIKWNNDSKGIVKINKSGVISFPKSDIDKQEMFLTHIPFGLSLYFHYISNKQSLINIPFEHWIDLYSRTFLKMPFYSYQKMKKLEDTLFSGKVIEQLSLHNLSLSDFQTESNEFGSYYYYKGKVKSYFYMKCKQRHLLYQILD